MTGRPSKYRAEFAKQAIKLCKLGATDKELADFFEVSEFTINQWKISQPGFSKALKAAKDEADDRVERSLYHKATGYTFTSEKVFCQNGEIVRAETVEHVPPSDTAMIFWLKNRRPEVWRDKRDYDYRGNVPVQKIQVEFIQSSEGNGAWHPEDQGAGDIQTTH